MGFTNVRIGYVHGRSKISWDDPQHILEVIGSNYSPHARSLTIDHEAQGVSLSDTLIRRKPEPKTVPGRALVIL